MNPIMSSYTDRSHSLNLSERVFLSTGIKQRLVQISASPNEICSSAHSYPQEASFCHHCHVTHIVCDVTELLIFYDVTECKGDSIFLPLASVHCFFGFLSFPSNACCLSENDSSTFFISLVWILVTSELQNTCKCQLVVTGADWWFTV